MDTKFAVLNAGWFFNLWTTRVNYWSNGDARRSYAGVEEEDEEESEWRRRRMTTVMTRTRRRRGRVVFSTLAIPTLILGVKLQ